MNYFVIIMFSSDKEHFMADYVLHNKYSEANERVEQLKEKEGSMYTYKICEVVAPDKDS
jgi:hypothetical protein